jgi:hypothetical protein
VDPVGLEDRDAETPPCDSLAEAIVLSALLRAPELIPLHSVEIRPLLVFPEHALLLTALERAYAATPRRDSEPWSRWSARVEARWMTRECETVAPGRGWVLAEMISPYGPIDATMTWRMRRWREVQDRFPDAAPCDFDRPWTWWLSRLHAVAEARQLVAAGHRIVERAWRGDVDGASAVILDLRQRRSVVRIDV